MLYIIKMPYRRDQHIQQYGTKNAIFTQLSGKENIYFGWYPEYYFNNYFFPVLFAIFFIVFLVYFN
jgi:hypothetical protein